MKARIIGGAFLVVAIVSGTAHGDRSGSSPSDRPSIEVPTKRESTAPAPRSSAKHRRFSALVRAAAEGRAQAVKALLKQGVDPNGRDVGDSAAPTNRPIVEASARGHAEIVKLLLDAGADPNWCCCSCVAALHEAIRDKHARIVDLLLEAGANPKLLYDGSKSPLELARESGDSEILALVERRLTRH